MRRSQCAGGFGELVGVWCVCVCEGLVGVGGESFFSPVSMSLVVQNYRFQNRLDGGLPEQLRS